ncbi:MAG TPA: hypothetical protein VGI55_14025 [Solirubrobacteraceae bacterium]
MAVAGDELVARAKAWVAESHPHPRHLERTRDWLLRLEPGASDALQLAALLHDIERAVPQTEPHSQPDWSATDYNDWHQDRAMRVAAGWLAEQGADPVLLAETCALIRVHENGGWPGADLVQAADSLSFLEVQVDMFISLVRSGAIGADEADAKFRWMHERVRVPRARELSAPMLEDALAQLAETTTEVT